MTPAINLLRKMKIKFTLHQYDHDSNETHYGQEAITKLTANLSIKDDQIFKTLIICLNERDKQFAVCVIPVNQQLNLKKVANLLGCKKVDLADSDVAQKLTGYLVGAISPLAQKKKLITLIDEQAQLLTSMLISGGKRGLDIEITAKDLAKIINANFANITA